MGFFSKLVSNTEAAESNQKKQEEQAKESWIKIQRKINPSRSIASIEAEWNSSRENSPRARDKRLFEEDQKYWEDIAAGRISKDTQLPSKVFFDSLSPQEQQAENLRKQQNFQASQIRAHNDLVESMTSKLQNNIALYGRDNANSVFMETELKKLTAQQPVFAPIGAAPVVNVTIATPSAPQTPAKELLDNGDDALWEQAAAEFESSNRKEALWIKCFSQAGGDENRAKALYYQSRVQQLSAEASQNLDTVSSISSQELISNSSIHDAEISPDNQKQPFLVGSLDKSESSTPVNKSTFEDSRVSKESKSSLLPYLGIIFIALAVLFIYFFIPSGDGNKAASGRWKLLLEISSPDSAGKIRAQEFSRELNSLNIIKTEVVKSSKGYLVVSEQSFASKSDASAKMSNVDNMFSSSGIKLHTGEIINTENIH